MRIVLVAAGVSVALAALASGYGPHRDELYFLAAGRHLDWAYADQGPLTPLIARAMSEPAPSSLTVLRLPAALAAGLTVLRPAELSEHLRGCREAARIDNRAGVDNEEQGRPVMICERTRRPWSQAWETLRHLG